jgi:hypothetical protein
MGDTHYVGALPPEPVTSGHEGCASNAIANHDEGGKVRARLMTRVKRISDFINSPRNAHAHKRIETSLPFVLVGGARCDLK